MSSGYNTARIVRGVTREFRITPTTAVEFRAGDALILASSKASPASSMADAGTKAQNQEAAHDVFLGFAMDGHKAGSTNDVLVAAEGDAKLPCAALGQAYDVGTLFGLAGTGTAAAVGVSDYEVEPVATANLAIGRLIETAAAGDTTVLIRFTSVVADVHGGPQAAA